jgi:hypothetical protein
MTMAGKTLKHALFGAAATLALSIGGAAQAADGWGIEHEKVTRVEAKVVDLLCEITGNCAPDCGGGKRQLGLLLDDGRLVPVAKNFDPFAGAVVDLIPFCGKRIVADGLLIEDPQMPLFALQFKREAPDGEWSRANWFGKEWSKANGGAKANEWFRKDPRVVEEIKANGVFGIPGLKPE